MIYYISTFKAFESLAKSIGKDGNYAKHLCACIPQGFDDLDAAAGG